MGELQEIYALIYDKKRQRAHIIDNAIDDVKDKYEKVPQDAEEMEKG